MSIHIKKENRGKFTATKKRTGKTTEELTHSKNPLTRKRAIFAANAKKWKHPDGGEIANNLSSVLPVLDFAVPGLGSGLSFVSSLVSNSKKPSLNLQQTSSPMMQEGGPLPVNKKMYKDLIGMSASELKLANKYISNFMSPTADLSLIGEPPRNIKKHLANARELQATVSQRLNDLDEGVKQAGRLAGLPMKAHGGGLSRSKDYGSSNKPYPSVKSGDFAGGGRSYPIPTRADAVDALRLAGLHGRSDVKAKVYAKYPDLKKQAGGKIDPDPKKTKVANDLNYSRTLQSYLNTYLNSPPGQHPDNGILMRTKGKGRIEDFNSASDKYQMNIKSDTTYSDGLYGFLDKLAHGKPQPTKISSYVKLSAKPKPRDPDAINYVRNDFLEKEQQYMDTAGIKNPRKKENLIERKAGGGLLLKQFNAPSHAAGGQMVDINGNPARGTAVAEIEGKENILVDKSGKSAPYVFSDRLGTAAKAAQINKKMKGNDSISRAGRRLAFDNLKKENEALRTQSFERQYPDGGPILSGLDSIPSYRTQPYEAINNAGALRGLSNMTTPSLLANPLFAPLISPATGPGRQRATDLGPALDLIPNQRTSPTPVLPPAPPVKGVGNTGAGRGGKRTKPAIVPPGSTAANPEVETTSERKPFGIVAPLPMLTRKMNEFGKLPTTTPSPVRQSAGVEKISSPFGSNITATDDQVYPGGKDGRLPNIGVFLKGAAYLGSAIDAFQPAEREQRVNPNFTPGDRLFSQTGASFQNLANQTLGQANVARETARSGSRNLGQLVNRQRAISSSAGRNLSDIFLGQKQYNDQIRMARGQREDMKAGAFQAEQIRKQTADSQNRAMRQDAIANLMTNINNLGTEFQKQDALRQMTADMNKAQQKQFMLDLVAINAQNPNFQLADPAAFQKALDSGDMEQVFKLIQFRKQ